MILREIVQAFIPPMPQFFRAHRPEHRITISRARTLLGDFAVHHSVASRVLRLDPVEEGKYSRKVSLSERQFTVVKGDVMVVPRFWSMMHLVTQNPHLFDFDPLVLKAVMRHGDVCSPGYRVVQLPGDRMFQYSVLQAVSKKGVTHQVSSLGTHLFAVALQRMLYVDRHLPRITHQVDGSMFGFERLLVDESGEKIRVFTRPDYMKNTSHALTLIQGKRTKHNRIVM